MRLAHRLFNGLGLGLCIGYHCARATPCSPNLCSGHGTCQSTPLTPAPRQCSCHHGWEGADCSHMTCPMHYAWSDEAAASDIGHQLAVCSNRGACDSDTGSCLCDDGFEGRACERKTCPLHCSGHGRCKSMRYHASTRDPGDEGSAVYSAIWDADMMHGCECDEGYEGPDCSLRTCPRGDDPLTTSDVNEKQAITCSATDGSFTLTFRGATTIPLSYNADAATVAAAIEALPTITSEAGSGISIEFGNGVTEACVVGAGGHGWTVEFLQDFGDLPLLVPYTSSLSHSSLSAYVTVSESVKGTKENAICSNRGLCDRTTGVCTCESGFESSNGYNSAGTRGDCGYDQSAATSCPGVTSCSGNGICSGNPEYVCTCNNGWTGGDCSLKQCPEGKAWFELPSAANEAHLNLVECSAAGKCIYTTGLCECIEGFEGAACDRITYPTNTPGTTCSGHGQCLTMSALAEVATDNGDPTSRTYGAGPNDPSTWDHDMVQGCHCDEGYWGYGCSLRTCPHGDDPATAGGDNEVQTVTCTGSTGSLDLSFRGQTTTTLYPGDSSSDLQDALESLSSIGRVDVTCDDLPICSNGGVECTIEFLTEMGDLPIIQATYDTVTVVVAEETAGTKENDECSHRGLCDYETGTCVCFPGYDSSDGQGNYGEQGDCGALLAWIPQLELYNW